MRKIVMSTRESATRIQPFLIVLCAISCVSLPAHSQPVTSPISPHTPIKPLITPKQNFNEKFHAILKQRIVDVSPKVASGGSQVLLTGLRPFAGPISVKFGALPASYAGVNPDGTVTAGAPYNGVAGSSVRISIVQNGAIVAESDDLFSYRIAHMEVTGPMPMDRSAIGDARWASGRGHLMVSYAPAVLAFSEQPVFHVSVAFVDDSGVSPPSYNPPFSVGNYGKFYAHLQNCDVSKPPVAGPSQCKNWDGNVGTWADAGPVVSLRLDSHRPDVSESGDLALKTDGLFDQANLVRTLRIVMSVEENDTIMSVGSDRVDSKDSSAFTAVLAPSAFIQVKVTPFTIVYQPPGNASTAFYQTSATYSTSFKLGNTTEQSNTSSSQQTESTKASVKLTIPAGGSSFAFGADMGESWDTTTKMGFGTAENSTDTTTNTIAVTVQTPLMRSAVLRA